MTIPLTTDRLQIISNGLYFCRKDALDDVAKAAYRGNEVDLKQAYENLEAIQELANQFEEFRKPQPGNHRMAIDVKKS